MLEGATPCLLLAAPLAATGAPPGSLGLPLTRGNRVVVIQRRLLPRHGPDQATLRREGVRRLLDAPPLLGYGAGRRPLGLLGLVGEIGRPKCRRLPLAAATAAVLAALQCRSRSERLEARLHVIFCVASSAPRRELRMLRRCPVAAFGSMFKGTPPIRLFLGRLRASRES